MTVHYPYGTTIENCDKAVEKAKTKDNGVYKLHSRGLTYRVRNNCVTHYAAYGTIYEKAYGFLVEVGKYDHFKDDIKKILNKI